MDHMPGWSYKTLKVQPDQLETTLAGWAMSGWECAALAPTTLAVWPEANAYADGSRPATVTEYIVVIRQRKMT